jgi:hypothetical protein
MTFKSMTLRKTHGKHHCRVCGKVVCHVCAANRIFMQVSNKFERVCNKCITDKDNREVVKIDVSLHSSLSPFMSSLMFACTDCIPRSPTLSSAL